MVHAALLTHNTPTWKSRLSALNTPPFCCREHDFPFHLHSSGIANELCHTCLPLTVNMFTRTVTRIVINSECVRTHCQMQKGSVKLSGTVSSCRGARLTPCFTPRPLQALPRLKLTPLAPFAWASATQPQPAIYTLKDQPAGLRAQWLVHGTLPRSNMRSALTSMPAKQLPSLAGMLRQRLW